MAIIQRVRTVFTGVAGTPWYSNIYCTATEGDAGPAVSAVDDFWQDLTLDIYQGISWIVEGTVANIDTVTGDVVGVSDNAEATGAGTSANEPLPYATQCLLQLRTGDYQGGREIRGRINIPGAPEHLNVNGKPATDYRGRVLASFEQNLGPSLNNGLNGSMVVWSKKNGTAPYVSGASVWTEWAVLRSRRD